MENKEKNFISSVVYLHNDENNIENFFTMLISVLERNFENAEIICVNDSSSDDSIYRIKQIVKDVPTYISVSVLNLSGFHGLETAMNSGVELSIGDFVFEFDTIKVDYDESMIMNVYKKALEGYDVVSASPNKKEKFFSKMFYELYEGYSDSHKRLRTERFRILSRRVINRMDSIHKMVLYRKAVYADCGFNTFSLSYDVTDNITYVMDKKAKKYKKGLAVDTLLLFTDIGYRFSVVMTAVMMFVSVFMLLYSIVIYLMAHPVEGWTTTILFLSFVFFGLFGILTIIIKYLQLIINLMFKRKRYIYSGIEKIK